MTNAEYRATVGTVTPRGKVHLAHGSHVQRVLCGPGNRAHQTTATLAVCDPDGDVCDALLSAEIAIARLCAKCFPIRTKMRYSAHIKTAIVACREGEPAAPCGQPNT